VPKADGGNSIAVSEGNAYASIRIRPNFHIRRAESLGGDETSPTLISIGDV
jgi:hypothetical protein